MKLRLTKSAKSYMEEKGITTVTITQDFVSSGCSGGLPHVEVRAQAPPEHERQAFVRLDQEGLVIYVKKNIEAKSEEGLTLSVTGLLMKSLSVTGVKIDAL